MSISHPADGPLVATGSAIGLWEPDLSSGVMVMHGAMRETLMKTLECLRRHPPSAHDAGYLLTDRLHEGRMVAASADQNPRIVSTWLAELGVGSPLVDQLARAVWTADWTAAHALADQLAVDVVPLAG